MFSIDPPHLLFLIPFVIPIDHAYFSNFVILGDFNVNFEPSHHLYSHLSDFMTSFSLTQVVDSPTHFSPSGQPSCIDLVFVSNLNTCSVIPQLTNSDHLGLFKGCGIGAAGAAMAAPLFS